MSQSSAGDNSVVLDESNGTSDSASNCGADQQTSPRKVPSTSEKKPMNSRRTTSFEFTPENFIRHASPPQMSAVTLMPSGQRSAASSSPYKETREMSPFFDISPRQSSSVAGDSLLETRMDHSVHEDLRCASAYSQQDFIERANESACTPTGWEAPVSHYEVDHDQCAYVEHQNTNPPETVPYSVANGTGDHLIFYQPSTQSISRSSVFPPVGTMDSSLKYEDPVPHDQTPLSHSSNQNIESQAEAPTENFLEVTMPLTYKSVASKVHDDSLHSLNCTAAEDVPFQSCTEYIADSSYVVNHVCGDETRRSFSLPSSVEHHEVPHVIGQPTTNVFISPSTMKNTTIHGLSSVSPNDTISFPLLGSVDSAFKRVSAAPESQENQKLPLEPSASTVPLSSGEFTNSSLHEAPKSANDQLRSSTCSCPGDSLLDYAISLPPHLKAPNILPNLDRCSPAQVVAATGGAPVDILRQIECGDGDGRDKIDRTRTSDHQHNGDQSARDGLRKDSTSVPHTAHQTSSTTLPPVINIRVRVDANLTPTSPDVVAASSEVIFGNFLTESYRMEVAASARASISTNTWGTTASTSSSAQASNNTEPSTSSSRVIPVEEDPFGLEFASIPRSEPGSMEAVVAHNLALIGDEINRTYGARLDSMIKILPTDECPLEIFSNVARVLFSRGPTNWGQVVALFCFGYRLVMRRVRRGLVSAFFQVCRCLISFCRQMNVFAWIAAQGGWRIVQYLTCGRNPDSLSDDLQSGEGSLLARAGIDANSWIPTNWTNSSLPSPSIWFVGLVAICSALFIYRRLRH
ncbi:bcl-2 homologous antagonist/killer [Clonorchis sinensis]|uniref:Bcl-2 homologous antagonist/killer n=1 Tax=Clonorchis sinensis TaxID=79923 RepID=H2KNS3_CLOSI|nr:bcl-2 homologous antagonist/killer [Clonorchis sinensis]